MFNRNKTAPTLNSSCSSFYLLPTSTQIAVNLVCSIPYCSGMSFSGCFSFEYSFLLLLESVSPFCIWEQWWRRLAWGQSSQPLHSPARNLGQSKWGLWCLPQRVVGGGWELNRKLDIRSTMPGSGLWREARGRVIRSVNSDCLGSNLSSATH